MKLQKTAVVGTLESSDVRITLSPNPGGGIEIDLESDVKALFGRSIENTVRAVLAEFQVEDARVDVRDRGALDCTIRARMQCVICRAAKTTYDCKSTIL